jgi:hypothetical protein
MPIETASPFNHTDLIIVLCGVGVLVFASSVRPRRGRSVVGLVAGVLVVVGLFVLRGQSGVWTGAVADGLTIVGVSLFVGLAIGFARRKSRSDSAERAVVG